MSLARALCEHTILGTQTPLYTRQTASCTPTLTPFTHTYYTRKYICGYMLYMHSQFPRRHPSPTPPPPPLQHTLSGTSWAVLYSSSSAAVSDCKLVMRSSKPMMRAASSLSALSSARRCEKLVHCFE